MFYISIENTIKYQVYVLILQFVQILIPALDKRKWKDVGIDLMFHICIEHTIKYYVYVKSDRK